MWKKIWKWATQNRIKVLLWKVAWKRLPTKVYLLSCNIQVSGRCHRCWEDLEDDSHALISCKFARNIWKNMALYLGWPSQPASLSNLWGRLENIKEKNLYCIYTKVVVACALDAIWRDRNDSLFRGEKARNYTTMQSITTATGSFIKANWDVYGRWGVTNDSLLNWCKCVRALNELKKENNLVGIWMEGDNKQIIDGINQNSVEPPQDIKYIIQDIKTWISNWDTVVVTHTNRSANRAADWLASQAKEARFSIHWNMHIPYELDIICKENARLLKGWKPPMERIKLKSLSGLAKILGITLCLAGVVTIAFYEGPSLASPNHLQLGHGVNGSAQHPQTHSTRTWIKGCFLLMISSAAWALWLIMQGKVMEEYPSKIIFTALQCLFSAIQSFFVALGFERHISGWKLGLDIGLFAIAYCDVAVRLCRTLIVAAGSSFSGSKHCARLALACLGWTPDGGGSLRRPVGKEKGETDEEKCS
ncbi:hypothetical protein Taro_043940 [Colocasia esculenta]|uniref:RNase H type-1 domain-containing protein n=1 Tax=Colocasia esculenta TaxID=4460 RepID=A0A843WTA8_COLES|nr:hypothetical protein [Colocasia esculenta]